MKEMDFFYNQQLRKYILQFMQVFTDVKVRVGKNDTQEDRLISVPIHYGLQDRVVAAILNDNTNIKPLRVPMMSAYMRSLDLAKDRMHGTFSERRKAYVPQGYVFPDDIQVVHQRMPTPYDMDIELTLYASNSDQQFQMLEQILPFFTPQLDIQTSDGLFDWTKLTSIELQRVNIDTAYPVGTERRMLQTTISFRIPIYLSVPAQVHNNFVNKVFARIGVVDGTLDDSMEIIGELDAQGVPYNLINDGGTTT